MQEDKANLLHDQQSGGSLTVEAVVTDRFPLLDTKPHRVLPRLASAFCFPQGISASWRGSPPSFFSFVLTGGFGDSVYGAAAHCAAVGY